GLLGTEGMADVYVGLEAIPALGAEAELPGTAAYNQEGPGVDIGEPLSNQQSGRDENLGKTTPVEAATSIAASPALSKIGARYFTPNEALSFASPHWTAMSAFPLFAASVMVSCSVLSAVLENLNGVSAAKPSFSGGSPHAGTCG